MTKDIDVFTDPIASPTGFPFKVMGLEDSLSEQAVYEAVLALAVLATFVICTRNQTVTWDFAVPPNQWTPT